MGSFKDPKTWIPHIIPKDCSKKICSISCTKWCKYIILPSPPPPPPLSSHDSGSTTLSPVAIVIITLIGTFFLLMGYYFMISRYCTRSSQSSMLETREVVNYNLDQTRDPELGVDGRDEAEDHSSYVPWVVIGKGLDEGFIKSISVFKYKKEDGLFTCTDCSVCLGEFQEDESIKVLPKCSHAFHVYCIDTWLKTHLNCPLCRANVCCDAKSSRLISPLPPPPTPPLPPVLTNELGERDVELEIREEGQMKLKRSKSMDYLCQTRVSLAQVMFLDRTHEMTRQEVGTRGDVGSSENVFQGNSKGLKFVHVSHFGVKRSYSSGGYSFSTTHGE
ncbi:putative transcription factor C2H2 family [Helianthus annuus]|uniref:RING-type E3 ubiquitin transferase n=1 Tax=Helianthus annuus TaxID=4232 RepID=A0A251V9C1_HELAN|nr:putative transcription factor C2H2 family [Helianthus annuus]KAJ0775042.1 putative transcription factor C2H2 family [Helianthus annuus]